MNNPKPELREEIDWMRAHLAKHPGPLYDHAGIRVTDTDSILALLSRPVDGLAGRLEDLADRLEKLDVIAGTQFATERSADLRSAAQVVRGGGRGSSSTETAAVSQVARPADAEPSCPWRPIASPPAEPAAVMLLFSTREWTDHSGGPVSFGPVRDHAERVEVGFWDGECWCEIGTGHDCFEEWRVEANDTPTHWAPIPPAECSLSGATAKPSMSLTTQEAKNPPTQRGRE